MGKVFIVAGPSGVGKGTILKKFLEKNPNTKSSISSTTRKPRAGEVEGVDYYFVSGAEFKRKIDDDEFLEWAQYSTNYYGTSKIIVEEMLKHDLDVILEIEVQGALQVIEKIPDCVSIFVIPPSLEELERRLRERETDDEDTILRRLNVANRELAQQDKFDYVIENNNLDFAIIELQKIYDKAKGS